MDQEKDANPLAEIFDEMFTLMQDLETRSVAVLEYLQEQGGVTDEKLAPYLDRAAAAADVRWRAARARMEHLLAPKPKSSTEVGKDEKSGSKSQPEVKGKEAEGAKAKPQGEKEQGTKAESKDVGKELASVPPDAQASNESQDSTAQNTKSTSDARTEQKKTGEEQEGKEKKATSKDAKSQAAALGGEKNADAQKADNAKGQKPQSDDGRQSSQSADEQKAQKATK